LRARPEPTQLEHLSDASFLGKLLVLPANVRLDWKVIARYKNTLAYLASLSATKKRKSFIELTPGEVGKVLAPVNNIGLAARGWLI
jgi:hypothetical protein